MSRENGPKLIIYKAVTPSGVVIENSYYGSVEELIKLLKAKNLILIEFSTTKTRNGKYNIASFLDDLQSLSFLLSSGINIDDAINVIITNANNHQRQLFWSTLLERLRQGIAFSAALKATLDEYKLYEVLPFITFLEINEEKGRIVEGIDSIRNILEERQKFKKSLLEKIYYPTFLIISSYLVLSIIMVFVLPNFQNLLDDTEKTPLYLNILFRISSLLSEKKILLIVIPIALLLLIKHPTTRNLLSKTPLISDISRKIFVYQFFKILSIGLSGGIKLDYLLKFLKDSSLFNHREVTILDKIYSDIKTGRTLTESLSEIKIIPKESIPVISAAEESNTLPQAFSKLSNRYKKELDSQISKLIHAIEPITLIVIGILVAFIIFSIMFSIISMTDIVSS